MVFSSLGKAKMGKFASKTSWKSFLKHFDHKWCMASRLKIKYSFRMSKSRQSISQPLSIIQHLLHLCELDNIGILPLHQNQQDVIPYWYLSRNFSIKSKCISLVNHYSCFKSDANLLPRQNASGVRRLWTKISTNQQSVGWDEEAEDMITIFGPESFYPFGALKKFASCFRQHPMVTMWQTLFSTNILENSSTKRIFSSFQNTIKYAKLSARAFDSFQP